MDYLLKIEHFADTKFSLRAFIFGDIMVRNNTKHTLTVYISTMKNEHIVKSLKHSVSAKVSPTFISVGYGNEVINDPAVSENVQKGFIGPSLARQISTWHGKSYMSILANVPEQYQRANIRKFVVVENQVVLRRREYIVTDTLYDDALRDFMRTGNDL